MEENEQVNERQSVQIKDLIIVFCLAFNNVIIAMNHTSSVFLNYKPNFKCKGYENLDACKLANYTAGSETLNSDKSLEIKNYTNPGYCEKFEYEVHNEEYSIVIEAICTFQVLCKMPRQSGPLLTKYLDNLVAKCLKLLNINDELKKSVERILQQKLFSIITFEVIDGSASSMDSGWEKLADILEKQPTEGEKQSKKKGIKHQYTKRELMQLESDALSNIRPNFLDNFRQLDRNPNQERKKGKKQVAFQLGPEEINEKRESKYNNEMSMNNKHSYNYSNEVTKDQLMGENKNVKNRLKKEQDIVLSPQRRSFNAGCFMPQRNRIVENHSTKTVENRESRYSNNSRSSNNSTVNNSEYSRKSGFNSNVIYNENQNSNSRKFSGYDKDRKSKENKFSRSYYGGNDRHNSDHYRVEEPEWMKDGGATSLSDFVELRGFDESKRKRNRSNKLATKNDKKLNSSVFGSKMVPYANANDRSINSAIKNENRRKNSDSESSSAPDTIFDSVMRNKTVYVHSRHLQNALQKRQQSNSESESSAAEDVKDKRTTEVKSSNQISATTNNIIIDKLMNGPMPSNSINLDALLQLELSDVISCDAIENQLKESKFSRWFSKSDQTKETDSFTSNNNFIDISAPSTVEFFNQFQNNVVEEQKSTEQNLLNLLGVNKSKSSLTTLETDVNSVMKSSDAETGVIHSVDEIEFKLFGAAKEKPKKSKEDEAELFKKLIQKAINETENLQIDQSATAPSEYKSELKRPREASSSLLETIETNNTDDELFGMVSGEGQNSNLLDHGAIKSANVMSQEQEAFSRLLSAASIGVKLPPIGPFLTSSSNSQQSQVNNSIANAQSSDVNADECAGIDSPVKIPEEMHTLINLCRITKEIVLRPEVQSIMKQLSTGAMMYHQIIEQLKRTPPHHIEFRGSLLCILKILKLQSIKGPPEENNLIPNMEKSFTVNNSSGSRVERYCEQNASPLVPRNQSLQTGLLKSVSIQHKHVSLKNLDMASKKKIDPINSTDKIAANNPTLISSSTHTSVTIVSLPLNTTSNNTVALSNSPITSEDPNFVVSSDKSEENKTARPSSPVSQQTPATVLWSMSVASEDNTDNESQDSQKSQTTVIAQNNMLTPYRCQPPPSHMFNFSNLYRPVVPHPTPTGNALWQRGFVGFQFPVQSNSSTTIAMQYPQRNVQNFANYEEQATLLTYNTGLNVVEGPVHVHFHQFHHPPQSFLFGPSYITPPPFTRKPGPMLTFPTVNYVHGSNIRLPPSGEELAISNYNRSVHAEFLTPPQSSRGQLPNASHSSGPLNMPRVEDIERMHQTNGRNTN